MQNYIHIKILQHKYGLTSICFQLGNLFFSPIQISEDESKIGNKIIAGYKGTLAGTTRILRI